MLTPAQLAAFEREGVLVVPNAVPLELCAAAVSAIESYLGKPAGAATDPTMSATWYEEPGLRYHGLISGNSHQALWETRQHPALYRIFTQLLGTTRLRVSGDATNFTPPENDVWRSEQHIHWDMDSSQHRADCPTLQGVLCLTDCAANQGGLVCVPRFHRHLETWARSQPPERNVQVPTPQDISGWEVQHVAADAGSIIIWNSALPHSNSRNSAAVPRVAQYITFSRDPPSAEVPATHKSTLHPPPLARGHLDVIGDALGVPPGSVQDWLHAHTQSDTIELALATEIEITPMQDGTTPYWLRIRPLQSADASAVDLHSEWATVRGRRRIAVQWEYLPRCRLKRGAATELARQQRAKTMAALDNSIRTLPACRSSHAARLSAPQIERLTETLLSRAPWRVANGDADSARVWSAETVSALIGEMFGVELLDTKPAALTALGRQLVGVDSWEGMEAAAVDARL